MTSFVPNFSVGEIVYVIDVTPCQGPCSPFLVGPGGNPTCNSCGGNNWNWNNFGSNPFGVGACVPCNSNVLAPGVTMPVIALRKGQIIKVDASQTGLNVTGPVINYTVSFPNIPGSKIFQETVTINAGQFPAMFPTTLNSSPGAFETALVGYGNILLQLGF